MHGRIDRARSIDGWMGDDELQWLHRTASGKQLVIELGSWCGKSSVVLASARRLVCVDSWQGSPNESHYAANMRDGGAYESFMRNLDAEISAGSVEARRGDLSDAAFAAALLGEFSSSADMVFVDAAHDEASVVRDIVLAQAMLNPGGILCGHDYSDCWPGVQAAVNRCVKKFSIAAGAIWVAE